MPHLNPCYLADLTAPALAAWLAARQTTSAHSAVLALLPEAEAASVATLQAVFKQAGRQLFGGIFPALVTNTGFCTQGVILIELPVASHGFLVEDLPHDSALAGCKLADAVESALSSYTQGDSPHLFAIFDSMQPNVGSLLINAFDRLQRQVSYAGVNAGSESFQPMPCLFDNQRCVSNGAIGILLPLAMQVAIQHGYPVTTSLMRATSAVGNRIDKINGEPAMMIYQKVIADDLGISLTPENFYDYAVHYPFGLVGSLDVLVRIPVAFNDDGSIFCVGEVPPNSVLRLLKAPSLHDSHCVDKIATVLGGPKAVPLMAFYCAGRRMHLGGDSVAELAALRRKSGASALFGALSLGEIGTDNDFGIPEFHNAALVCLRQA